MAKRTEFLEIPHLGGDSLAIPRDRPVVFRRSVLDLTGGDCRLDDLASAADELVVRVEVCKAPGRLVTGLTGFVRHINSREVFRLYSTWQPGNASFYVTDVDAIHFGPRTGRWAQMIESKLKLRVKDAVLWFGSGDVSSPLHYDRHDFLILQLDGPKQWLLYPPRAFSDLNQPSDAFVFHTTLGPLDIDSPLPLEHCGGPVGFVLEPGDAALIPRYWWHQVEADSPNCFFRAAVPSRGRRRLAVLRHRAHWYLMGRRLSWILRGALRKPRSKWWVGDGYPQVEVD